MTGREMLYPRRQLKMVCHLAVVVIAAGRSLRNFGGTGSEKCQRATKSSGSQTFLEYERIGIYV